MEKKEGEAGDIAEGFVVVPNERFAPPMEKKDCDGAL